MAEQILLRLRQRRKDTPTQIDSLAMEALQQYDWPGNIRELENMLENASAFCRGQTIRIEDLDLSAIVERADDTTKDEPTGKTSLAGMTLAEIEKQAILDTLDWHNGNKARTARELGISEKSVYNKMRRHGLFPP